MKRRVFVDGILVMGWGGDKSGMFLWPECMEEAGCE